MPVNANSPTAQIEQPTRSIDRLLRDYAADIETWSPIMCESGLLTLPKREALHESRARMTAEQRAELGRIDLQTLCHHALAAGLDDLFHDIADLGKIVDIIETENSEALDAQTVAAAIREARWFSTRRTPPVSAGSRCYALRSETWLYAAAGDLDEVVNRVDAEDGDSDFMDAYIPARFDGLSAADFDMLPAWAQQKLRDWFGRTATFRELQAAIEGGAAGFDTAYVPPGVVLTLAQVEGWLRIRQMEGAAAAEDYALATGWVPA